MIDPLFVVAGSPSAPDWTSYVQTGGVVGVLALLIVGILKQWIVPGWSYSAMEKDRDYYRNIANQSLLLADRQTTVAEALTRRLDENERNRTEDRLQARADVLRRDDREDQERRDRR